MRLFLLKRYRSGNYISLSVDFQMDPRLKRINAEILKCEEMLLILNLVTSQGAKEVNWSARLRQVLDAVEGLTSDKWYIQFVKKKLEEVLTSIIALNIAKDRDWDVMYFLLNQCVFVFEVCTWIPIPYAMQAFGILYKKLNTAIGNREEWIITKERDKKISSIMNSLGYGIDNISNEAIDSIIGGDGINDMKTIAKILKGESNDK